MPVPLIPPTICLDWRQFFPHMLQPLPRLHQLARTLEGLQISCLQTPDQHKEQLFSILCPFLNKMQMQVLGLYLILVNQIQVHQVLEHCLVLNFFGEVQLLTLSIQTLHGLHLLWGFHLRLESKGRVFHILVIEVLFLAPIPIITLDLLHQAFHLIGILAISPSHQKLLS